MYFSPSPYPPQTRDVPILKKGLSYFFIQKIIRRTMISFLIVSM